MRFLNSVREPREGGEDRHDHHASRDQDEEKSDDDESGATAESVGQAVLAFETDPQAQANGLHAALNQAGPGLRVTLTDINGNVLRELSGEEFLRLRQATSGAGADTHVRGKILDQKL